MSEYTPVTFSLTRADLLAYAEASGDHNPIHSDDAVAAAVGLPGVIAHGMLTMGLAASAAQTWFPEGEVVDFGTKFTSPVVVPAEGSVDVVFAVKAAKEADGVVTLTLDVTSGDAKVLGNPRITVRTV